jgi:hypothetical protein
MNDDIPTLRRQIERCRRIASIMTDDEVRHSLEQLAEEYEAQLPKRGAGFMLQHRDEPLHRRSARR